MKIKFFKRTFRNKRKDVVQYIIILAIISIIAAFAYPKIKDKEKCATTVATSSIDSTLSNDEISYDASNCITTVASKPMTNNFTFTDTTQTQNQTIALSNLKSVSNADTDTGSVSVTNVSGNNVTLHLINGTKTTITQTGGSASNSKYVTAQPSINYSDAQGYTGTLTAYISGTTTTPSDTKYATYSQSGTVYSTFSCSLYPTHGWTRTGSTYSPGSYAYNYGGYTGYLTVTGASSYPYMPSSSSCTYSGQTTTGTIGAIINYGGNVTKPATTSNTYLYQGTVTKPDTRTYSTTYTYNVTINYLQN